MSLKNPKLGFLYMNIVRHLSGGPNPGQVSLFLCECYIEVSGNTRYNLDYPGSNHFWKKTVLYIPPMPKITSVAWGWAPRRLTDNIINLHLPPAGDSKGIQSLWQGSRGQRPRVSSHVIFMWGMPSSRNSSETCLKPCFSYRARA